MKQTRIVHATVLSVLMIATAGFSYAQHDDKNKGHDRQDNKGRQAQASVGQRGQQREHGQAQQQRPQQQRNARPQQGERQQRMSRDQQRNDWQQHRARNFDSQRQTWTQRGGYRGERIPDRNFRRSFGRNHSFRIFGLPYMEMGGRQRFQYGGYWFSLMDPYPEYWGANWYQNDDMYVDYNDGGYYLYNRRYPRRPGVAISISF